MDRISLNANERSVVGKKVKTLRKQGLVPGHVYGDKVEGENVAVVGTEFLKVFAHAGETGLIDLKIGSEKVRPVLIRDIQYDPVKDNLLNIDFYQVNLREKVTVPVPVVLIGDQPESVHMGEAVVLQTLSEVSVEALPTDLIEKIEVNISNLKNIDDAISVAQLNIDRSKLNILADGEEIVVKLAPAITEEMKKLMEEQAAEQAAAAEAAATAEGVEGEAKVEGEEGAEAAEGEQATEGGEVAKPESLEAEKAPEEAK
ncbi:50S ribosomal protein L25 [Candidatus Daviesbacteria bacterium]|nr:50S ribosomal protein L25 [Candidatus Daviesbacteria bacterium]